ncbi:MAG TPA: rhodanese-like domain-containing protein [Ktedonobacterales bacterium]|nr:rhodanese-like domain-containing protein [Ktedonobacterales bacterium]
MVRKTEMLAAFAQTGAVLDDFLASRSAAERADAGGRQDDFSAKELVALTGFWMRYMVERMGFHQRGEEPPHEVDFDALNRDELARQASLSWDEVARQTKADLTALVAEVEQSPEAFLRTPNYYGDQEPGPIEGEILANGFTWALQEMEKYYQRRGETTRASDIHARLVSVNGEEPEMTTCDLMTPEQIQNAAPQPLIIDVRGPKEYAAGHLPGARNLPLSKLARLVAKPDALPKDHPIVTYCNMHHPGESRGERAAALLAEHGYPAAALAGGYSAWAEHFPTETGAAE